jgi:phosphatidylglycerophosphate synthase
VIDPNIIIPGSGYPEELPTASGDPITIIVDATSEAAFQRLWGLTLLERNLRLVERLGARSIHIFARAQDADRAKRRKLTGTSEPIVHVSESMSHADLGRLVTEAPGPVLILEGQAVYDRRFTALMWQQAAPTVGTNGTQPLEALALLVDRSSASILSDLGDAATGKPRAGTILTNESIRQVDLHSLDHRVPHLRKSVAPQIIRIEDAASRKRADEFLKSFAGKGINDLVGEFIHPPIEFLLTRIVARTPVTPDQISYLIIVLSVVAIPLFAVGRLWEGIAINLIRGVIDGVDGKLARLTLRESEAGNVLDHGTDTAYLPLLFAAFGYHLADGDWLSAAALSSYLLHFFYWHNRLFTSWYRNFFDEADGEFRGSDRLVRRIHPKRNIFILLLVIAMLVGRPEFALYGITALTMFMHFFRIARVDQEGRRLKRQRDSEK